MLTRLYYESSACQSFEKAQVLQHQFGRVSRELESLGRAAALVRAGDFS